MPPAPPTNPQLPPGGTAQLLPSLGLIPNVPAVNVGPTAAAPGPSSVGFMPGSMQVPVNTPFPLAVNLNTANDAFSVNLRVKYDPALLQLNDVVPGDLLSRDGARVTTVKDIRNESGEATLTVTRILGSPGLNGPGAVATLNFVSRGPGSTTVTVTELGLKNSQQQVIPVTLGGVPVTVQP